MCLKVKPDDTVSTWTLTDSRGGGRRWAPPGACLAGTDLHSHGAWRCFFHSHLPPRVCKVIYFHYDATASDSCALCVNCMKPDRKCSSVPGTAYSSSLEQWRGGPDRCHTSWGACRGAVPTPAMRVRAVALRPCSCRPPVLRWEAIVQPSFIHLACLFAFSRLIFSSFPDFLNPELFSLRVWLNEGAVGIFPYSRNLFTEIRN